MNVALASLFSEPAFMHHADPLEILGLVQCRAGKRRVLGRQMPSGSSIWQLQLEDLLSFHLEECADKFTFSV